MSHTLLPIALVLGLGLLVAPADVHAADPPIKVDPPVKVFVITTDGKRVNGQATGFDSQSVTIIDRTKKTHQVAWQDLDTRRLYHVYSKLLEHDDATGWVKLGHRLQRRADGAKMAETAFARARLADPDINTDAPAGGVPDAAPTSTPTATSSVGPVGPVGPVVSGGSSRLRWPKLAPEQQAAAVEELKTFARNAQQKLGVSLSAEETDFFLFVSDLPAREVKKWTGVLDEMYDRLCDMFGLEPGENIWRGKALVFVFSKREMYVDFEAKVMNHNAGGSAGLCHAFGNGNVIISFYRQPDEITFAHVLVHESAHGFIHRYISPAMVISWINEGLVEVIASRVIKRSKITDVRRKQARAELKRRAALANGPLRLGSFFTTLQIDAWHYGVAADLTELMLNEKKKGYVAFIKGIKGGVPWQESLKEHFGVSLDKLVAGYGRSIGVPNLRP